MNDQEKIFNDIKSVLTDKNYAFDDLLAALGQFTAYCIVRSVDSEPQVANKLQHHGKYTYKIAMDIVSKERGKMWAIRKGGKVLAEYRQLEEAEARKSG